MTVDASAAEVQAALLSFEADPDLGDGPMALAAEAVRDLKFSFCLPPTLAIQVVRRRLENPAGVTAVVGKDVAVANR